MVWLGYVYRLFLIHASEKGESQLSNEFKFPIAAFHHAMEAYLVPDLLKKAYGTHDFTHLQCRR